MAPVGPSLFFAAHRVDVIACLGYALFLATNATVVWGGVFPFLPAEHQTPLMTTTFFFMQASACALYYLLGVVLAYRRPHLASRFRMAPVALPYLLGWSLLIGTMYFDGMAPALTVVSGALLGLGTAGFFLMWQRLFAAMRPDTANARIIVGTLFAPPLYFLLYLIPTAVTSLLIPLVFMPLFALCVVLVAREVDFSQPAFTDVPSQHPQVYRHVVKDYWRSALCVGSIAFSCGVIRALAIGAPRVGAVVNNASMVALFAMALVVLGLWHKKPLRLNISILFHLFYPVLITVFAVMAVVGERYLGTLAALLYALYGVTTILTMVQCSQASHDRGVNPAFVYGFVAGIMYALHDVGFIFGSVAKWVEPFGLDHVTCASVVSLYVLGLISFVGQGGVKAALSPNQLHAGHIELFSTSARQHRNRPTAAPAVDAAHRPATDAAPFEDKTAKQCALLQRHFKLSNRESQIVQCVARGYTTAAIAQTYGLSENTVQTHMKRLYHKLDIHKKQQLIDLVRTFDPHALNDAALEE